MNEQDLVRKALSGLHASENTLEEVIKMANEPKSARRNRRVWKTALIAAAVIALCVTSAFAADYVLNQREVFFFDSLEALRAAPEAQHTGSYAVPGSMEENRDMQTVAEYVDFRMKFGLFGEETLLSEETSPAADALWERRRVTECDHETYGKITNEYLTGQAYAEKLAVGGLLNWDLSAVTEVMTADENGQIVIVSRNSGGDIVTAHALLGYTTAEGARFQIEYNHSVPAAGEASAETVIAEFYDYSYLYTTPDSAEVLILMYDGQIWAKAQAPVAGNAVYIYTTGCTAAEMEALLDQMELSAALGAGA